MKCSFFNRSDDWPCYPPDGEAEFILKNVYDTSMFSGDGETLCWGHLQHVVTMLIKVLAEFNDEVVWFDERHFGYLRHRRGLIPWQPCGNFDRCPRRAWRVNRPVGVATSRSPGLFFVALGRREIGSR